MPQVTQPLAVTGAVILVDQFSRGTQLLGTAFLISPDVFMTARHVLEPSVRGYGERISVVFAEPQVDVNPVKATWLHPKYDVGLGRLSAARVNFDVYDIIWFEPKADSDVMAFDFSETSAKSQQPDGALGFELAPTFQKGHILRTYDDRFGSRVPTRSIDVSFPAFKGASGGAVLDAVSRRVCAMLVGNTERHLLPAHLDQVLDKDGLLVESRSYFLPIGRAIHWSVLAEAVQLCPFAPNEATGGRGLPAHPLR